MPLHVPLLRTQVDAAPGSAVTYAVIRSAGDIERLRPLWEELQADPNVEIDSYLSLLRQRGNVLRPHVIHLSGRGGSAGLVIGRLERIRPVLRLGYCRLPLPRMTALIVMRGGILGELVDACAADVVRMLLDSLQTENVDALFLSGLPAGSPLHVLAAQGGSFLSRDRAPERHVHWQMAVPADMAEFYGRLSKKRRHEIKRKINQVHRACGDDVRVRVFGAPGELDEMIRDVGVIARSTYHARIGAGFVDGASTRERLAIAAGQGRLRSYVLYLRGRPVAFWMGTVMRDTLFLDYTGYQGDCRHMEPGSVLFVKMVESLCRSPVRRIDFGSGDAFYKHRFGTSNWQEVSLYVFGRRLRALYVNTLRTAAGAAGRLARGVMTVLRVGDRVKRVWRHSLQATAAPDADPIDLSAGAGRTGPDSNRQVSDPAALGRVPRARTSVERSP